MSASIKKFRELFEAEFAHTLPQSSFVQCQPTSNPAAYIDTETNRVICRFTYWEDGSFHSEGLPIGGAHDELGFTHIGIAANEAELRFALAKFRDYVLEA